MVTSSIDGLLLAEEKEGFSKENTHKINHPKHVSSEISSEIRKLNKTGRISKITNSSDTKKIHFL